MDISNEARKHLLAFLQKVLDGSYTQNESENFSFLSYQNDGLEQVREAVSKMIKHIPNTGHWCQKPIGQDDRSYIETVIFELQKQCNQ
jgi:hypothetical protein